MSYHCRYKFFAIVMAFIIFFTGFSLSWVTTRAAAVDWVTLSCTSKTMEIGDQMYLSAYSATGGTPIYRSSNPYVASVNSAGKITANAPGNVRITATINGKSATCNVTVNRVRVEICASGIKIQKKGSYRLRASASNYSTIVWRSKNPAVATVSPSGVVTGKKPGTATITASAGGATASCVVTVLAPTIKLTSSKITLAPNQSRRLVATASNHMKPVWSSSNQAVASVDSNGTIKAHKKGTATITASVDGATSKCVVTVK